MDEIIKFSLVRTRIIKHMNYMTNIGSITCINLIMSLKSIKLYYISLNCSLLSALFLNH